MGFIGMQVELGLLTDKGFISSYTNAFGLKNEPHFLSNLLYF